MIRLVNQFDPPTRRASVATATCCSCCCCCCCLVSTVAMTTFTSINLPASAKSHGQASALGRAIGAGFALCIFLPVIGAALALASLAGSDGGGGGAGNAIVFSLILIVILGSILSGLYGSTREPHPVIAGFLIAGIGSVISVSEALLVLYGALSAALPGGFVFVVYILLLGGGVVAAVQLGPRVRWPRY